MSVNVVIWNVWMAFFWHTELRQYITKLCTQLEFVEQFEFSIWTHSTWLLSVIKQTTCIINLSDFEEYLFKC